MIERMARPLIVEALSDTPVVVLHGPRQAGKSTLVRSIAAGEHPAEYVTLDDLAPRRAAIADPEGFIAGLGPAAVIDEVQLAPGLFRAIKASVDRDRRPGRLLLTGSADLMLQPDLAESLAGRLERHTLWPLAEAELRGAGGNTVDRLFAADPPRLEAELGREEYLAMALRGGYPEAVARAAGRRRARWFAAYLETMVERDVRSLANLHGLLEIPRLLAAFADRVGGLLNVADLARDLAMQRTTVQRYLEVLELAFLIDRLPAWHRNIGKRLRRAPKALFVDTGLMAHVLDLGDVGSPAVERKAGALIENFAAMEVRKLLAAAETDARPYHYRSEDGAEVDLVLERRGGSLVGLEFKASGAVSSRDTRGLRGLREATGDDFIAGVLFHTGRSSVAFGDRLWALPLAALWSSA